MRGSSAESGASGGGASGVERGSRKRPAPLDVSTLLSAEELMLMLDEEPAAAQGLGSRKAKAGASSHEPIELSDGE